MILGAIATGLFALFGLDLNATVPHKLYRDALAKTFVQSRLGEPDITLSSANSGHAAPYHLIKATVNLPSSRSPVLRDRRSDFFLLSKCWMGSASTGYFVTEKWKIGRNAVNLATAMAISGAAASPHMGLGSKPTLAALLTFLNIRLGLWAPRPGTAGKGVQTPGFMCLLVSAHLGRVASARRKVVDAVTCVSIQGGCDHRDRPRHSQPRRQGCAHPVADRSSGRRPGAYR